MIYTTLGAICGSCGHTHHSLRTALRCLRRSQRGCRMQGGYSDRRIVRATHLPLSDAEAAEVDAMR